MMERNLQKEHVDQNIVEFLQQSDNSYTMPGRKDEDGESIYKPKMFFRYSLKETVAFDNKDYLDDKETYYRFHKVVKNKNTSGCFQQNLTMIVDVSIAKK